MYPDDEVPIASVPISPADVMSASVTTDGQGDYTMTIADLSTGSSFTTTQYSADAESSSAEVIAEAPSDGSSQYPLADFGTVSFTNCSIDGVAISSHDWILLNMVAGSTTLASTSALGSSGDSFSVTTGAGAPTQDLTPPSTTVSGADSGWHRSPVVLSFSASDNAGGSGVAYTEYSLDGGATWTQGTSVTVPAPADHSYDGIHTVQYRSADNAGNVESAKSCTVKIDTLGPACRARNATVASNGSCKLRFKVFDRLSPKVTTELVIRTKSGHVVKRFRWGYGKNSSGWWWTRYNCRLPPGIFAINVYGKDLAGNDQSVVGQARLRVK